MQNALKKDNQWKIGIDINDENRFDVSKWRGKNLLGRILMEIRQELKYRKATGKLEYVDHRNDNSSVWEMKAGELKNIPQFYNTIHAYSDYLDKYSKAYFYTMPMNYVESLMGTNMGGGLPAIGFWELKRDIFEISDLV